MQTARHLLLQALSFNLKLKYRHTYRNGAEFFSASFLYLIGTNMICVIGNENKKAMVWMIEYQSVNHSFYL